MSYVGNVLREGETVIATGEVHWSVYLQPFVWLAMAIAAFAVPLGQEHAETVDMVSKLLLLMFVVSFIRAFIERKTTEIAVTDQRVIYKRGLVSRDVKEIHFNKIESVNLTQSVLGRLLDFGTVSVQGTGVNAADIARVARPLRFRELHPGPLNAPSRWNRTSRPHVLYASSQSRRRDNGRHPHRIGNPGRRREADGRAS